MPRRLTESFESRPSQAGLALRGAGLHAPPESTLEGHDMLQRTIHWFARHTWLFCLIAVVGFAKAAHADEPAPVRPRGMPSKRIPNADPNERLKVYVLTFSPGDHPFYKFGHNAIWIHDEDELPMRWDLVYNYGMFAFGDPALIPKFFRGRFLYWLEPHSYAGTILGYKKEGRGIESQELDLPLAQRREIKRLLDENAQDENKYYKYDYYRDNCATRVRDMIDRVTGGRVRAAAQQPGRLTWREHTSRLTADLVSEYVILNLVMGNLIDKKRPVWDESFIPMELQSLLEKVTIVGEDGEEHPLVKERKTILKPLSPPPPDNPPTRWPYSLAIGVLLGGALAGLGRLGAKKPVARAGYGVLLAFFGFICGFFGTFFLAAWAFTDHEVGYHNENVLLCVPWGFVLVGTGINVARGNLQSAVLTQRLVLAALVTTLFAVVAKVLPWFDQDNTLFLVLFLPFWAGAFYGIREIVKNWVVVAAPVFAQIPVAAEREDSGDKPRRKKKKPQPPAEPAPAEPAPTDEIPEEVPAKDEPPPDST